MDGLRLLNVHPLLEHFTVCALVSHFCVVVKLKKLRWELETLLTSSAELKRRLGWWGMNTPQSFTGCDNRRRECPRVNWNNEVSKGVKGGC